jgi:hypothetical protein
MPERINGGLVLVVLGAVGLIVSLSLDWFRPGLSAWTVFEIVDLLLATLAVAALAIAIGQTLDPAGSLARLSPRWLPAVGIAALVMVTEALINHPPAAVDHSTKSGAWIALGAAAALTVGGLLSTARVSLVITLRPRQEGTEWEHEDEYAETEYVDEVDSDAEYQEPEPTAEHSVIDDETRPLGEDERG